MSSPQNAAHGPLLDRLLQITDRIAMQGDFKNVDALLELARTDQTDPRLAKLAESFARIVVQLEAREFRLECMIEDLLQVKTELEKANYDALTGLPNRVIFKDRLRQAMLQAEEAERLVGVFFLDLNRFKWVNDNLGHDAGDELLQQVAERLRACVREQDTLARLGGDEFTCVQVSIEHHAHAEQMAQRFIDVLTTPFELASGPVQIGTSVGIALFPRDAQDADELIRQADQAMYRAKSARTAGFAWHQG